MSLLSKAKIDCKYTSSGCNEKVLYDQLEKHEAKCKFQKIICKFCKTAVFLFKLEEHELTCDSAEKPCPHCHQLIPVKKIKDHDPLQCISNRLLAQEKWCSGFEEKVLKKFESFELRLTNIEKGLESHKYQSPKSDEEKNIGNTSIPKVTFPSKSELIHV